MVYARVMQDSQHPIPEFRDDSATGCTGIVYGQQSPSPSVGNLSHAVCSLWAKSNMFSSNPGERGTPLYAHLLDAAGAAQALWDTWVPSSVKEAISEPFEGVDQARLFLSVCAGLHDLGKASPAFQSKVDTLYACIPDGLRTPYVKNAYPIEGDSDSFARWKRAQAIEHHTRAGGVHLYRSRSGMYTASGVKNSALETLVSSVVGHHGSFAAMNSPDEVPEHGYPKSRRDEAFGVGEWDNVRDELIDLVLGAVGAPPQYMESLAEIKMTLPARVLTASLVVMSDWIASSESVIPLVPREEWANVPTTLDRGRKAVSSLNFPPQWNPRAVTSDIPSAYQQRFSKQGKTFIPTSLQVTAAEAAQSGDAPPGFMLIEAPTGTGKTEAALMAAEILAYRHGRSGILYTMPTRATSDAAYTRVKSWINAMGTGSVSLTLHHGMSVFNEEYANDLGTVKKRRNKSSVQDTFDMTVHTCEPDCDAGAEAHTWFSSGGKRILSSMVVGTIDALLEAGIDKKHVAMKHLGLHSKVVIIDEVHSSDTYMLEYLCTVLRWAGMYGIPVIALTATATPSLRARLHREYTGNNKLPQVESANFPTVTTSSRLDGHISEHLPLPNQEDHSVMFESSSALYTAEEVAAEAVRLYRSGGAVCVVSNTVRRAQEVFKSVLELGVPLEDAELNHSRFTVSDRRRKDLDLLNRLGKDKPRKPCLVVATQVVEQSLDIDFDIMLSDVAPLDYLIQRAGRVHRHINTRPRGMETARVVLCGHKLENGVPKFNRGAGIGDRIVYPTFSAMSSLAWIGTRRPFAPISDTVDVMNVLDGDDSIIPVEWMDKWENSRIAESRNIDIKLSTSGLARIGSPRDSLPLHKFPSPINVSGTHPDRWRYESVRSGIGGDNVILLWEDDGAARLMPEVVPNIYMDTDLMVDFRTVIDPSAHYWAFRHAARSAVNLPASREHGTSLWSAIKSSPNNLLLRRGTRSTWANDKTRYLALSKVVHEDGSHAYETVFSGFRVTYSVKSGLEISEDNKNH